jgi:septal ring factor EnvC (AmiA/AmiB activator)
VALDQIRALRILALKEAVNKQQSNDYQLRSIFRWYSKTFHTPLHLVYNLPELDVLQAYYEDAYEHLSESAQESAESKSKLDELVMELAMTDDELRQYELAKDKEDLWHYSNTKEALEQEVRQGKQNKAQQQKKAKEQAEKEKQSSKELELLMNRDAVGGNGLAPSISNMKVQEVIGDPLDNFSMDFGELGGLGDIDTLSSFTGLN